MIVFLQLFAYNNKLYFRGLQEIIIFVLDYFFLINVYLSAYIKY